LHYVLLRTAGSEAKKLRQQQSLDEALTRLLEVLQPAAARKAAAAALAAHLQQQQQQQQPANAVNASASASPAAAAAGSLAQLNVGEVASLVGQLAPEAQRAVEDDLGQYTSLCMKLR
jgi:hypothetical protein